MSDRRVMLVTGGSRGTGAAVARLASLEGYAVAVNYRAEETVARGVVSAIRDAGGTTVAVRGDVSVEADVRGIFAETERLLGPVSHLVNSAGTDGNRSAAADFDAGVLTRLFAVNVIGTMLRCREAVPRMSARRGGGGGAIGAVNRARHPGPGIGRIHGGPRCPT